MGLSSFGRLLSSQDRSRIGQLLQPRWTGSGSIPVLGDKAMANV